MKEKNGEKPQKEQRCQRRRRAPWQSRHTPEVTDVHRGIILEHGKRVIKEREQRETTKNRQLFR